MLPAGIGKIFFCSKGIFWKRAQLQTPCSACFTRFSMKIFLRYSCIRVSWILVILVAYNISHAYPQLEGNAMIIHNPSWENCLCLVGISDVSWCQKYAKLLSHPGNLNPCTQRNNPVCYAEGNLHFSIPTLSGTRMGIPRKSGDSWSFQPKYGSQLTCNNLKKKMKTTYVFFGGPCLTLQFIDVESIV